MIMRKKEEIELKLERLNYRLMDYGIPDERDEQFIRGVISGLLWVLYDKKKDEENLGGERDVYS